MHSSKCKGLGNLKDQSFWANFELFYVLECTLCSNSDWFVENFIQQDRSGPKIWSLTPKLININWNLLLSIWQFIRNMYLTKKRDNKYIFNPEFFWIYLKKRNTKKSRSLCSGFGGSGDLFVHRIISPLKLFVQYCYKLLQVGQIRPPRDKFTVQWRVSKYVPIYFTKFCLWNHF